MKLSSKKTIIGLSGITTGSYYFWLSSSNLISYNHFLIQNAFLFAFSLISLGFFFFFIDKKIFNQNVKFIINILIATWIIVISIKTLFYLSNVTTLPKVINNFLNFDTLNASLLIKRLIIFFVPYLSVFLLLLIFKKFLEKIFLFLSFLGIVLILLINFEIVSEILFKNNIEKINNVQSVKQNNSNKKVIWIIFDEFDPEIAFKNENMNMMDNFKNIKDKGVFVTNFYSTAKNTLYAMTSTLIGKPIKKLWVKKRVIFVDDGKKQTPFVYKNTLFKELKDSGLSFKILSSVFPYCYHLKLEREECISISMSDYSKFKNSFYAGTLHVFSPLKKINRFLDLAQINKTKNHRSFEIVDDEDIIKNLEPKIRENEINKFDEGIITFNDFNEALSSEKNLIFLHIFLPHLGKEGDNFSKRIFEVDTLDPMNQYLLNLKSTNIILGKIMNSINKFNDDKTLIVLSSDHWYRLKDTTTAKNYPSLLLLKINDESQSFINQKKITSISINNIIKQFLNEKIDTHDDIDKFLLNEKFFEPYSYVGNKFN